MSMGGLFSNAPIRSFSQRVEIPWVDSGPAGIAQVSLVQIVRDLDDASPKLAHAAALSTTVSTAQLVLASGALTIGLTSVKVMDANSDSVQDGVPVEKITLAFRTMTWTYNNGGEPVTFTYDMSTHEGTGGFTLTPQFVFLGAGVDAAAAQGATLFSKLVFGLTVPQSLPGQGTGRAAVSPLTVVTGITAETVKQLSAAVGQTSSDSVTARFIALATSGTAVDRMAYTLANPRLSAVAIDTSPTGVLQATVAIRTGGMIVWTAQPLNGGPAVTTQWNPFDVSAH
jgi:type VI protein secretion system component Hcp